MMRQKTHDKIVAGLQKQIKDLKNQLTETWENIGILFGDNLPEKLAQLREMRSVKINNVDKARTLARQLLAYADREDADVETLNGVIMTAETILANKVDLEEVEVPAEVAAALASIANVETDA